MRRATKEQAELRRVSCRACPHAEPWPGLPGKFRHCLLRGEFITTLTNDADAACPLSEPAWVAVPLTVKSRGLGDTIAKIAERTGLAKVAKVFERVTGKGCGCGKRQEALNKLVPYEH